MGSLGSVLSVLDDMFATDLFRFGKLLLGVLDTLGQNILCFSTSKLLYGVFVTSEEGKFEISNFGLFGLHFGEENLDNNFELFSLKFDLLALSGLNFVLLAQFLVNFL